MAAFELAVSLGATEVETDVQFSKDRQVILFHDTTIHRITNGAGPVSDYTLAELRAFDAGSWFSAPRGWERDYTGERIITLRELLSRFQDTLMYHIEIKRYEAGLVAMQ